MKFVAVHLMTHRKCYVDCPFPYHLTGAGGELSPPPPLLGELLEQYTLLLSGLNTRFLLHFQPRKFRGFCTLHNFANSAKNIFLGYSLGISRSSVSNTLNSIATSICESVKVGGITTKINPHPLPLMREKIAKAKYPFFKSTPFPWPTLYIEER
jgi:hypothetical protein